MTAKTLEKGLESLVFPINLPKDRRFLFSHIENIEYCIKQLRRFASKIRNPVVGYISARSLSTIEIDHAVMPQELAERWRRGQDLKFEYVTIREFLEKKTNIDKGKYIVENGQILGLNPTYSE